MAVVEESSGDEESNQCKMGTEVGEVASGLGGGDLARHEVKDENHGIEGLDEENKDTCSLVLGVQNSSVDEGVITSTRARAKHYRRGWAEKT